MSDGVQDLDPRGDGTGEMRPVRLDAHTAERLLTGAVTRDDAPPGYAGLARLLDSARSAPAHDPGPVAPPTLGAMSVALAGSRTPAPADHPDRRTSMLPKALSLKAVIVTSAVLLGAGTAAAATGSLPGAAQTTASDVLHDVGISVPGPNSHNDGTADTRGDSAEHAKSEEAHESASAADADDTGKAGTNAPKDKDEGKGPSTHALFGLCTAEKANDGHPNANADVFPSAATCASVTHPGKHKGDDTSGPDGNATENAGSTDHPEGPPGTPGGQPSSTPGSDQAPVQTPNEGGASDTAPNGHAGDAGQTGSRGATESAGASQSGGPGH